MPEVNRFRVHTNDPHEAENDDNVHLWSGVKYKQKATEIFSHHDSKKREAISL